MEETKKSKYGVEQTEDGEQTSLTLKDIYTIAIINWKLFVVSIVVCLAVAYVYTRYATPIYQSSAKMLVKEEENNYYAKSSTLASSTLGLISNSTGIDNEIEILSSTIIAKDAVTKLKLYTSYYVKAGFRWRTIYKTNPIIADMKEDDLENLETPITIVIERLGNDYKLKCKYYVEDLTTNEYEPIEIEKTFQKLPQRLSTKVGRVSLTENPEFQMDDGDELKIIITSPEAAAAHYYSSTSVEATSKMTTIALITNSDENPDRSMDYVKQLIESYNDEANKDKNEVGLRTELFINSRLEKINAELGSTESELETYKKNNQMIEIKANAEVALKNQDDFSKKLAEAKMQIELLKSIEDYMNEPANKYQTLPSNVGLTDQAATSLIATYNEIALKRNNLLRSANEKSPTVAPFTAQLDDLDASIRRAMKQSQRNIQIQIDAISKQYGSYTNQLTETPERERIVAQIGRQQEVKSSLYIMLLQKREENSISLASTADKGKLIDGPLYHGKVAPRSRIIMLLALVLGIAIPACLLYLRKLLSYKIEGHEDVERLSSLPIIADVAVAKDQSKQKADIVVHPNHNSQMEEIFRSMRTNLTFMLGEGENVIMFTSATSGEGKTFNAANLAMSLALLDKRIILVGLDIRKPRLAELFEIKDHHHGITPLLTIAEPTSEQVEEQILKSGVNDNLDLLMSGPTPPNPAELLTHKSLDIVIGYLREAYDYVILDTAPVGLVSDTLQIGRLANTTVYVCRADYTPKDSISHLNEMVEQKKLPNVCIVVNGIDMSKMKNKVYYGYGGYGGYGSYSYGTYSHSHYGMKDDNSVKL